MRKSILIAGLLCTALILSEAFVIAANLDPLPMFNWNQTSFDFGKIEIGKPVTHEFTFTNTGNAPLLISSVLASCGCTVVEYTKDLIPPGSFGTVKATYNSAKKGVFNKTITVNANTKEGVVVLTISGEVITD